jgi:hypothetical protein
MPSILSSANSASAPGTPFIFGRSNSGNGSPGREMDLIEMAVAELEKGKG